MHVCMYVCMYVYRTGNVSKAHNLHSKIVYRHLKITVLTHFTEQNNSEV